MKRILAAAIILPAAALVIYLLWPSSVDPGRNASRAPVSSAATTSSLRDPPPAFTQTIPFSQIKFDMVLVPGDPAQGIKPFYMGRREVTWDEFMPWAACKDAPDELGQWQLRALKQRPSAPYWQVDRGLGMANRPALSMSRLSAELYCQWLSQQTGRKFRLPTEKEWEHAYVRGGGDLKKPLTQDEANRIALWNGNSFVKEASRTMTLPVGSKAPNALGIYDMAGSVAEWVTDTGNDRVVRGGHYESDLEHLGGLGREKQDDEVWNSNDPGDPKSPWWFHDHPGIGMRVVCEP